MTINEAADYFVFLSRQKPENPISPLKLQKLLYFAQGWSYYWDNTALFPEEFEAWTYGPVNVEIYHRFKQYVSSPIPDREGSKPKMKDAEKETIDAVWLKYGEYSSSRLVELTHRQTPWREAFETNSTISNESIERYFKDTF
jgi:uncharacterized phage-associated protein